MEAFAFGNCSQTIKSQIIFFYSPFCSRKIIPPPHPPRFGNDEKEKPTKLIVSGTIFINSFLIENKCLINLKCFNQRAQVKSGRIMTDIMGSIAYCTLHQDVHARRSPGWRYSSLETQGRRFSWMAKVNPVTGWRNHVLFYLLPKVMLGRKNKPGELLFESQMLYIF